LLFYLVSRGVNWRNVTSTLTQIPGSSISLALILIAIQVMIVTYRWFIIVQKLGAKIPFIEITKYSLIGLFASHAAPSVGGDALRAYLLHRQGISLTLCFNSVLLDRLFAMVGLLMLIVTTQPLLIRITAGHAVTWIFPFTLTAIIVSTAVVVLVGRRWQGCSQFFPVRILVCIGQATHTLLNSARCLTAIVALAMVGFVLLTAAFYCIAQGMGIETEFWKVSVMCSPVIFFASLPISMAGWGVREGLMVVALGYLGVPPDQSLALSIAYGLCILTISLPGAVFWLLSPSRS
jgi:glycosyltransferase 2 family protein